MEDECKRTSSEGQSDQKTTALILLEMTAEQATRIHSAIEAGTFAQALANAGLDNISVSLVLPEEANTLALQSERKWRATERARRINTGDADVPPLP
jgi:hypothetical protein